MNQARGNSTQIQLPASDRISACSDSAGFGRVLSQIGSDRVLQLVFQLNVFL
jgi:hypothetical protein